jgi:tetratricopeptide (TPR) repeat protein
MKRSARLLWAFASLLVVSLPASPCVALEEPDRLWLVGERASADGLHVVARRTLERLVETYPRDAHVPQAVLLLGQARLALGDPAGALQAFRRAQGFDPQPGRPLETKFWEAEALFRLRRYMEASAAYDEIVRSDATAPFAPDALYGYGWSELELKRPEIAAKAFRDLMTAWPDHSLVPSATLNLGRALAAQNRFEETTNLLQDFATKYPKHKLAADALYLRGWARVQAGDTRGGVSDLKMFADANPTHPDVSAARRLITDTVVRNGGDPQDLIDAYRSLMAQAPPTPEGLFDAAMIAGRLNRARDQDAAWRKLRQAFPEHPLSRRVALELASTAYKRKDWKETVSQAQPATLSDDDAVRSEAWLLLGEGELKLKRFGNAEKAFDTALGLPSLEDTLRYRALAGLGLAREELRDWRGAMTAYDQVAANCPDPTLKDWARERFTAVKARLDAPRAPEKKAPEEKKAPDKGAKPRSGT